MSSSAERPSPGGSSPDSPSGGSAALNPKVIGISIAAAVGGFLFGFDTSVINGAVNALSDEFSLGAGLTGFAVSSALIGCAVGAWFTGGLANRFGRVPVMVIAAVLFFASAVGSGLAVGVWDLIRSEEHTSELQSRGHLVCRLLLEKKKKKIQRRECVII